MRLSKIARTVGSLLGSTRPVILYHKPTARCDCRCRFCDSWVEQPGVEEPVSSARILSFLDRAHAAGLAMYVVWGGEPLLAADLGQWLERARGHGMRTVICTSASRLTERARELAPHTERLLLSLEGVGESHDDIRGVPGLFARVEQGLAEWRNHTRAEVVIWCNLGTHNRDQAAAVARLAREWRVGVEFFPTARYQGFNDRLVLAGDERRALFHEIAALKRQGFPVRNSQWALELMGSGRTFRCNFPKLSVQLDAQGRLWACDARVIPDLRSFGEMDQVDLKELPRSPSWQNTTNGLAACNACLLPCVADLADSLPGQLLRKVVGRTVTRLFK